MKKIFSFGLFSLFAFSVFSQDNSNVKMSVFPNPDPTGGQATVSLEGFNARDLLVVVYDMLGNEIYSKIEVSESNGFLFSLSSDGYKLPSGIYLITASANDAVFRQKLIVK